MSIFNRIYHAIFVTSGPRNTSNAQKLSIALLAPTSWQGALTPSRMHVSIAYLAPISWQSEFSCSQSHVKHAAVCTAVAPKRSSTSWGWALFAIPWVLVAIFTGRLLFLWHNATEFTRNALKSHLCSQVRLSCDGKLTRNRTNSNFHTKSAIVILAPIWVEKHCSLGVIQQSREWAKVECACVCVCEFVCVCTGGLQGSTAGHAAIVKWHLACWTHYIETRTVFLWAFGSITLANIFFLTEFTCASVTQASSHAQPKTFSSAQFFSPEEANLAKR